MKQGRTVQALALEVDRQRKSKRDFLVAEPEMLMVADNRLPRLVLPGNNKDGSELEFGITNLAHDQIAMRLDIPRKYYQRMMNEYPNLLSANVNGWLQRQNRGQRLIRTLDGKVRAYLSNRYRPLDNYGLLEAILPILQAEGMSIMSCEITDKKMYIKAVNERVQGEITKGDIVQAGVIISNSEVGWGCLSVEGFLLRLVCQNGMVLPDRVMRKYHSGGRLTADIEDGMLWEDDTRKVSDAAIWLQTRDLVKVTISDNNFICQVERLKKAAGIELPPQIEKVVEVTAKMYSFDETEKAGVLSHLIKGGDLSMWGLANAVTTQAGVTESYDRATELERVGGEIVELPLSTFKFSDN